LPLLVTLTINYRRCCCYQKIISASVLDIGEQLIASTCDKLSVANISANFHKKLEMAQIGDSKASGKLIMKKT
jgi:hypothetical protein